MLALEKVSHDSLTEFAKACGIPNHGQGTCWVLQDGNGPFSFAVVSENNIILSFGTHPAFRRLGYARSLFDMLTVLYDELKVAVIRDPAVEATLLGAGFLYDGDNVMKYRKEVPHA